MKIKVNKEQLNELIDLVEEVAEWDKYYSSTNLRIRAKRIIKSIKD